MDPSALPALIEALRKEDNPHDTQYYLIESAGQLGPKARDAIPALFDTASGKQDSFRYLATRALGRIGGEAMPRIVELLKHGDSSARSSAIRVLGEMDPSVRDTAVRALVSALHHEEWWTRMQAAEVLATFGAAANEALPRLKELGENPAHARERICMVMAGWHISGDAGPAIDNLGQLMESRDSTTRRRAAEALGQIFAREEEALPHEAID